MRPTKFRLGATIAFVMAALMVLPLGVASAAPTPKVTGGIQVGLGYAAFNAFDYSPSADRGSITWTNYDAASSTSVPSGIWKIKVGTFNMTFMEYGVPYVHEITIDSITPFGVDKIAFEGDGMRITAGSQKSTITGTVERDAYGVTKVSWVLTYVDDLGAPTGYVATSTDGVINPTSGTVDGRDVTGIATDQYTRTSPLTWTLSGAAMEVYNYTAPVTCAWVDSTSHQAVFSYNIPAGQVNSGWPIRMKMTDGGSPGVADTFGYDYTTTPGASLPCDGVSPSGMPLISSGNLTVH